MVKEVGKKLVAQNKKARHDYSIEDVYECGMVLTGTEVKSLRAGRASLVDGLDKVPYISILSAFQFENGDTEGALEMVGNALEMNSEYPLAKLLKRVYLAGWPVDSFTQMRNELDPKVRSKAFEMKDITIGELLNA